MILLILHITFGLSTLATSAIAVGSRILTTDRPETSNKLSWIISGLCGATLTSGTGLLLMTENPNIATFCQNVILYSIITGIGIISTQRKGALMNKLISKPLLPTAAGLAVSVLGVLNTLR